MVASQDTEKHMVKDSSKVTRSERLKKAIKQNETFFKLSHRKELELEIKIEIEEGHNNMQLSQKRSENTKPAQKNFFQDEPLKKKN